jgi:hypothetical protein
LGNTARLAHASFTFCGRCRIRRPRGSGRTHRSGSNLHRERP